MKSSTLLNQLETRRRVKNSGRGQALPVGFNILQSNEALTGDVRILQAKTIHSNIN